MKTHQKFTCPFCKGTGQLSRSLLPIKTILNISEDLKSKNYETYTYKKATHPTKVTTNSGHIGFKRWLPNFCTHGEPWNYKTKKQEYVPGMKAYYYFRLPFSWILWIKLSGLGTAMIENDLIKKRFVLPKSGNVKYYYETEEIFSKSVSENFEMKNQKQVCKKNIDQTYSYTDPIFDKDEFD